MTITLLTFDRNKYNIYFFENMYNIFILPEKDSYHENSTPSTQISYCSYIYIFFTLSFNLF